MNVKVCLLSPLLAMTAAAPAQGSPFGTPLPNLEVRADDNVLVDCGMVLGCLDSFYVDMPKAVAALVGGALRADDSTVSILLQGKERVRIHTAVGGDPMALSLDNSGNVVRKFRLRSIPIQDADSAHTWRIDVGVLADILGDTVELDGATLRFYTPEFWANKLGIPADRCAGLNARSLGRGLRFGVTPPSHQKVVWLKPAEHGYAQLYSLAGEAKGMLGRDRSGNVVDDPTGDQVGPEACGADVPARAITEYVHETQPGETGTEPVYASYAAVFTPAELPNDDPIEAVQSGQLGNNWFVIGIRQELAGSPLKFDVFRFGNTKGLDAFAKAHNTELDLLDEMNGYQRGDKPKPDSKLLVLTGVRQGQLVSSTLKAGNPYEVGPNDTVDGLAQKWGVTAQDVVALNSDLLPGQALVPGMILTSIKGGARPSVAKITELNLQGRIKSPTFLRQSTAIGSPHVLDDLEPGDPVLVSYQVSDKLYQVTVTKGGQTYTGYLSMNKVATENPLVAQSQVQSDRDLSPLQQKIQNVALAHLGTRYLWGGNNLNSGIDCSHFVAAVLHLANAPVVPSPPVQTQEQYGQIVHYKTGSARRGVKMLPPFGPTPSVNKLHVGDRIIIQWNLSGKVATRHTGIFVGRCRDQFGHLVKYGVANASSSHGTTVTDLFKFWKGYRYSVRDTDLPQ